MSKRKENYYSENRWCFTDKLSYEAGEKIGIRVSNPGGLFSCVITRVGESEAVVFERNGLSAKSYDISAEAYKSGCDWPTAFEIEVPADWRSGYYRIRLICETLIAEHFVVIKNANPKGAPFILVLATNTYHAYNSWGGKCLYGTDIPFVEQPMLDTEANLSPIVSTRRPFSRWLVASPRPMRVPDPDRRMYGAGCGVPEAIQKMQPEDDFSPWDMAAGFYNKWEHMFVRWAEREGFDLDYLAQEDLELEPDRLYRHSCVLSVGHDEYWSWRGRDAVEQFVMAGGNAAFFSGNACYWQVRFEDQMSKMVGYKYDAHVSDPVMGTANERYMTGMWSDPSIGRPETQMKGTTFTRAGYARVGLCMGARPPGFTIMQEDHWSLDGTDLFYGDMFGDDAGLAAYEVDGCDYTIRDGLPVPTGEDGADPDMEIIALAPASLGESERTNLMQSLGHKDASLFAERIIGEDSPRNRSRARRGTAAIVAFNKGQGSIYSSSTTEWAWGLELGDDASCQITRNILNRFG